MMEQPEHGVDYHDDGDDIGLPVLLVVLAAGFAVPISLVLYLLAVVLPG